MVKPIVKDILFLGQKSVPATPLDMNVVNDLRDTLAANRERCVGMAANMIGYKYCKCRTCRYDYDQSGDLF